MKIIPQLPLARAVRLRGIVLAALAALAVVAPLRADTITYDFDDGTAQGWTNVLTSPNDPPTAYEPSSRSDAAAAAQSGSFRVIPQIAGPFSPTEDTPHNTLVFRSPEFVLGPTGSISLFLNIGHGLGSGLVANFTSLPASSSTFGFEGVGLRRVSDGAYVLSARRSEFGVDAWTPVEFSNGSIAANGLVGTPLTLDLIDYCDGPWGWVALDTVTLYDALAGTNNLPGWLRNPATGNYYKMTEVLTWTEAQATAQSWGGNLVTINDAAENEWICQTFGTNEVFWIGLNDQAQEGTWVWASGEPVTFQNWGPGEPNNLRDEDYVCINYWESNYPAPGYGFWNDYDLDSVTTLRGIVERSGPGAPPVVRCASCEEILLTGRGTNSGYYDISPDGVTVINAYCNMTNGHGWTIIDPAHDANWGRFFTAWNLYAGGLAYGNGISCSSWRQWFTLADTNTQFTTSPNGRDIGPEGIIYRMTGNYYGCRWYNRNCDFDGQVHVCAVSGSACATIEGTNPWSTGHQCNGAAPWYTPDVTYCADCSYDWWNSAPSIGANGTHCVAYLPKIDGPPVITCPANVLIGTNLGSSSALVAFSVSATGLPAPVVTCTLGGSVITSPFAFSLGTNVVTCIATNAVGTDTCTFTVTVVDTIPPVVTVDSGFNPGSSGGRHVLSLAVQTDGKILVGGDFSTLGGQPRNMIGRLNSDGTLDASFNPGADNWVYALAPQADGKILVGGHFTTLDGQSRDRIGRLNSDGTLDTSFINPGADHQVYAFAVQADGKILVGGFFTTLGGQPRNYFGRLNADGTLDTSFNPGADARVVSIAVQTDGKILVGGEFTTLGGQPRDRIGRLNAGGTLDSGFNPGANSGVYSLAVQADGKILVGGYFTTLGGQPRNYMGRLNTDGTLDPTFNPEANNVVTLFAVQADGKILVDGFFTTLGGQPCNYMGRLNANGTLDPAFNPEASSIVYSLAVQADGKILVGGSFTMLDGQPRDHIARLNNTGPATERLTCDGSGITWLRGGTGPELWRTSFEHSTNGTVWAPLGAGARIPGGWQLTGVVLPPGTIRARGHVTGGYLNSSGWFVETIAPVETAVWPPVITCPTNVLTGADPGRGSTLVAFSVSATGAPAPVVTCTLGGAVITSPYAFPVGANAVTCTASNIAGVTTCTFTVTVRDTEPPRIACPTNIAVAFTSADGAAVSFAATATDNCAAPVRVNCVPVSGSTFPIGTTLVLCSATDTAGNSASCRFQVTVLGARGVKQQVLSELMALRAGVTGHTGNDRLDAAVGFLTDALDPALWLDETHLTLKHGEQVFQREKDAVNKLRHPVNDRRSTLSAAALEEFVARLVKVDWLLAVVSVQEASAAGLDPKKAAQGLEGIARGDAEAAAGRAEQAIEHYRNAWKHVAHSQVKGHVSMRGGKVRVQFTAFPDGRYAIQASTNLVDWETLRTVAANPEGVIDFEDPDSAVYRARYYRVLGP